MKDRPLVFVPTYNERENVVSLVRDLLALPLELDLLFVDDNSSDGTGLALERTDEGLAPRHDIVGAHTMDEQFPAAQPFGLGHFERFADCVADVVLAVRIDQQRFGHLVRGAGEA